MKKLLIIHGPNMNLIGLRSAKDGSRITIDRIDRVIRRKAKEFNFDLKILNFVVDEDIPFLMEVTTKTYADTKGGVLYQDKGQIKLLETANVPLEHIPEFCGNQKFKFFNKKTKNNSCS